MKYLVASAVVTRFAIAFVRIDKNRPKRIQTLETTQAEKKQAFAERAFIEIIGTSGYIFLLHLGQDIAAKFFEWKYRDLLKNTKVEALKELADSNFGLEHKHFSDAYDRAHNNLSTRNIINNMLYEGNSLKRISKKRFCEKLGVPITHPLPNALAKQGKILNIMCFGSLLFGVLLSAVAGGAGIQWFNDHIFSSYIRRKYPEITPSGFLTIPAPAHSLKHPPINPFAFSALEGGKAS